jgi:ATP-dependent Clp endopeptidase proteolytic subunit ClpP
MDEELRAARIRLMNAEALSKELAAEFGKIQVEEATRNWGLEKNSAHADRIFTFANIVRNETVQQCMRTLDVWARQEPGCDITLVLNSPGGDAFAGFALIDFLNGLRDRGHKITIKVIGAAMSMAVTILQAADERIIGPNGYLMIHEASLELGDLSYSEMVDQSKRTERIQNRVFNILAERSTLSVSNIKRRAKKNDWLLDAEEALRYGFVDRIAA